MIEPPEGYQADPPDNSDNSHDDLYQEVLDYSSGRDVGCLSTLLMYAIGGAGLIYTLAVILT